MKEFGYLVDQLVSLNIRNRNLIPRGRIPPFQYLLDHETVQINIGRATGKTDYIISHAKDGDLIVTFGQPSARFISDQLDFNEKIKIVYRMEDLVGWNSKSFKTMYIDEPRLCYRNIRKETLYEYFYNGSIESQLVIMLGE